MLQGSSNPIMLRRIWLIFAQATTVGLALGLSPKEIGLQKHVVKPTSVIDWSTSVVAGVGAGDGGW